MIKKIFSILFVVFSAITLFYLSFPNFDFPSPPPGALRSQEPGDTETPLRRAYFTDYDRGQVMEWYKNQMSHSSFLGLPLPTYLLNYPPEDAQTLIRDQTRTTFLEEIVHPMRESLYVNGFEPSNPKDAVIIEGTHYRQKIIIKYVPSDLFVRFGVLVGLIAFVILIFNSWSKTLKDFRNLKIKIW